MLNALTSFRFVAALMVFLWHIGMLQNYQLGYTGVSFFFVLSGFILTYNYHSKFKYFNKENIKKFYLARIAKIYPVHFLTFILSIPLAIRIFLNGGESFSNFLLSVFTNVLLIQGYFPIREINFAFNGVSWSLSNEVFFYAFFPVLLWIALKITKSNAKRSLPILICCWFTLILLTFAGSFYREVHIDDWLIYVFPLFRVFDFIVGIMLGIIFINIKDNPKENKKFLFTLFELSSICVLLLALTFSTHISQAFRFSVYYLPVWCLLIFTFSFQRGYFSSFLSNKMLIHLGEISFSFYMIHQLVIRYMNALPFGQVIHGLVSLIIAVFLSSIIYRFYEEPIRKKIRYGYKQNNKKLNESHAF